MKTEKDVVRVGSRKGGKVVECEVEYPAAVDRKEALTLDDLAFIRQVYVREAKRLSETVSENTFVRACLAGVRLAIGKMAKPEMVAWSGEVSAKTVRRTAGEWAMTEGVGTNQARLLFDAKNAEQSLEIAEVICRTELGIGGSWTVGK